MSDSKQSQSDEPTEVPKIKEREALLQAILDNAVDAIISIDMCGIVQEVNPATESLFGFKSDEIIGNNVSMLMPSPFHEEHDTYLANYLRTGDKKIIGIGREVLGRRKDGTTFPMHLAVSEVNAGGCRLFTGIVRDISDVKAAELRLAAMNEQLEDRVNQRTAELKSAQAELLRKERLATLGQVSGGIAHEIRNPLNAVKTSAFYLLHAKKLTKEKLTEHLERIDRQVTMIDNVVTAVSDVARLPEPRLRPHSVKDCLSEVLQRVSLPDNIDVSISTPESLPKVMVDENQIPIVFQNLVRNARDAMPDGGQLRITVSCREDRVIVEVADTGHGISAEQLKQITEPLYSTKARGMGLGLAISTAILNKNLGEMDISSTLGSGSSFRVELQAAIEEQGDV